MAIRINDNGTERNMTAAEETEYLAYSAAREAEAEAQAAALKAKSEARQAVLDKLGLNADEAAALFG